MPSSATPGLNPLPGTRARCTRPGDTVTACAAAWSTGPHAAGKNHASRTVVADSPAPDTVRPPSGPTRASNGEGRGARASAAENKGASADAPGVPAGKTSRNVPSSGTQIFSHTSHDAEASTTNAPAAGVTTSGSTTSPV